MRISVFTLLMLFFSFHQPIYAALVPLASGGEKTTFERPLKETKKIDGRKITFFQKIISPLLYHKWSRKINGEATPRQLKQGKWSMILGLGSLVLLFIPYAVILSIPAAIAAIILGRKSVKGNNNKFGRIGFIAGIVSIVFLIAAVAVLAFLFSGGIR